VIEDGKTGYLVPPRDPGELAKAILQFFSDQKSEEFINNIRKDKHRFSWETMVAVIESLVFNYHSDRNDRKILDQ